MRKLFCKRTWKIIYVLSQFSSVTQSCLTLCDPMYCSMPGFPFHHQLLELAQTHVHWVVMPSNHLILCHPLLLPSIFPSIRVFPNESVLHIRQPKYWSFSFSIHPSNEVNSSITSHTTIFRKWELRDLLLVYSKISSLWLLGHKESDTTERLTHTHSYISPFCPLSRSCFIVWSGCTETLMYHMNKCS